MSDSQSDAQSPKIEDKAVKVDADELAHQASLNHISTIDSSPSTQTTPSTVKTVRSQQRRRSPQRPRGVKPNFKTLIGLTLVTALLLLPFALSPTYLDHLRTASVDLHQYLRGELYKQATGFIALAFVLAEVMLTARKRSRSWIGHLKLPGSMMIWRSVHIFLGVGLVGMVLVHTIGATGINFNAIFLWVFFAVTLSALIGVVAETGILESTRRYFGKLPGSSQPITKGPLIRRLRDLWLLSHIFFVCIFGVMLVFHIFLAYYYQ